MTDLASLDTFRDQLSADLERIAREVPELPSTFGELRQLLALLEPVGGNTPYEYRDSTAPQAQGQALNQPSLLGTPPQNQTTQPTNPSAASYLQTSDTQLLRTGMKAMTYSDLSYGPATLLIDGDIIAALNAGWVFTYNGDGTLATATRSGAAGAATVTVTYGTPGFISSVVVVRGGKTVTVTPTYSEGRIVNIARAVA